MVNQHSGTHEAVFFMAGGRVTKRMHFSEFEALLDGLGTLPEYADKPAFAVYSVISRTGKPLSFVFFKLYFDSNGVADTSWNVPVERLSEISPEGPDLGAGPIRLATQNQCAINWHQKDLWEPDASGADIDAIVEAINDNRLRLVFESEDEASAPTLEAMAEDELEVDSEKRLKLMRLIKEQRMRIQSLESHQSKQSSEPDKETRIVLHAYKNEIQELKQTVEQLRVTNERIQEKLALRNEQFIDLQDRVSGQAGLVADLEAKLKDANENERDEIEKQKMQAEIVLLREQLDRKDMDLAFKVEAESQLKEEMDELKSRLRESGGGGVFDTLKEMDVVYVAYHPGAGHITMSASEVMDYAVNPMEFVANKCYVSEAHYREWLEHFENSVCSTCQTSIEKISIPSEYEPGLSNFCDLHKVSGS